MKYNTYDVINGGPRLVGIAKDRKNKALHFGRKEVLAVLKKNYKKRPGCILSFFFISCFSVDCLFEKG